MTYYFLSQGYEDISVIIEKQLYYQNVMFAIVYTFFLATFREEPPIPPTPVATAPVKLLNICDSFKLMKQNSNYGLLVLAFGINQAALYSIGVLK